MVDAPAGRRRTQARTRHRRLLALPFMRQAGPVPEPSAPSSSRTDGVAAAPPPQPAGGTCAPRDRKSVV